MKCCYTCKYFSTGNGASRYNSNYVESQKPSCKTRSKDNRHIQVKPDMCCDRYKAAKLKGLVI